MPTNVLLAAASFAPGNGGIARLARLLDRVLAEEMFAGQIEARAVSFLDRNTLNSSLPAKAVRGIRSRFVWEMHAAALSSRFFLYDSLSLARAHSRLPLLRRPFLAWIHGIEIWELAKAAHLYYARRAEMLIASSAYTRDRADRLHGGFKRALICWPGTESDDAPPLPSLGSRRPTVMILGRMDELNYKGHEELIAFWPRVINAVRDARLLIVGGGTNQRELLRQAAISPAAESIVFKGFVPDADMPKLWDEATVFAMPSRGEGFGLVYIEAMRQGLPVIASIHDAGPEVNLEGVTGYNVNLDKPDQLLDRLVYLLRHPDRSWRLGRNGQNHWREFFTYSAFKKRFLPIFRAFVTSSGNVRKGQP